MLRTTVVALALAGLLLAPVRASAQPTQKLYSQSASGTITANGGSVEMLNTGGLGSLRVQSSGTYTGTWEMQCSAAPTGITPVYDADDELNMTLDGVSLAAVQSVTDSVAVWSVNIAGCTAVKAIATSSMTGTLTIYLYATTTGGSSGGGGGSSSPASDGATGSAVPSSASYDGINVAGTLRGETGVGVGSHFAQAVAIVDSSGNQISTFGGAGGTSVNEDVASADAHPGTPAYTVRNNTLTGATNADGDYQPAKSTAAGATYTAPSFGDVVAVAGNGATTTGTQRVTLANDSTGVLATVGTVTTVATVTSVTAIGTSVTPGTSAAHLGKAEDAIAGSGDTGVMALGVRADTAAPTAANGDYMPALYDALGKLWTTGSYAEDAAHTSADTGLEVLAVRRDADTTLADTTGDYAPLQVNAGGQLKVACISGCSGSTFADNAAFTFGTTVIVPIGGVFDDVGTNAATENSAAVARITANKALHVNLRTAAGVEITPATDVTEDAAETAGGTGPAVMSVRRDTPASSAGTTGDNATFNTGPEGGLYTSPVATAGTSAGATTHAFQSAASNNATNIKASAGNLYGIHAVNTTATLYYLRLYNLSSSPTCSSATGFIETIPVPASATGAGVVLEFPVGKAFTTGIGYCLTGGGTSTDNTNAATGVYVGFEYK